MNYRLPRRPGFYHSYQGWGIPFTTGILLGTAFSNQLYYPQYVYPQPYYYGPIPPYPVYPYYWRH